MKHKSNKFLAVLFGMGSALTQLQAQTVAAGDLILFFQKPGDTDTVYVKLGNAATLYRGAESGPSAARQVLNIININSTLVSAFGAGWAIDSDIYAGLSGVFENSTNTTVVNGDQYRTLYVSKARTSVGTVGASGSTTWNLFSVGSLTTGATNMRGMNTNFATQLPNLAQGKVTTEFSFIDDQNPTSLSGVQSQAFGQFTGGVQQKGSDSAFGTFGPAGQVEFALDLQRLVPDSTVNAGEVAGTSRTGSYEGTVTVGTNGSVSFITQGSGPTATPYETWIAAFNPPIINESDKLPSADPDNDGLTNLMEFVLNGNPGVSDSPPILPTLNAAGTDFVFTFKRRDDSEANNTLVFQYGINLMDWNDVAVGSSGATVGGATVGIVENSTSPDSITLTVPKSVAPGGKLFGRLKATQP